RPQQSGCDIGAYESFASSFPMAAVKAYQLIGTVNALPLAPSTKQSLGATLEAAVKSINAGNVKEAANQLRAFINHMNALVRSGVLTESQQSSLVARAQVVLDMIGG